MSASAVVSSATFVGREHELTQLCAELEQVAAGRGRVFLVAGEPGIGKTRLCEELAAEASRKGARVLWGRCIEGGGAPPFWPWIQILRAYAAGCSPAALATQLAVAGAVLAQIVPEIFTVLPDLVASALEGEAARFRLFDAVTTFLRNGAAEQPLVLVLDDLHAVDVPSLLLLQFLARGIGDARMLVIVTFRDAEVAQSPTIAELVGEAGRGSQRIVLHGLDAPEVERLMERRLAAADLAEPQKACTPELAASVHEATGGNPFFVDEVLRLLVSERGFDADQDRTLVGQPIPHQVREAVRRHLRPLSTDAREILTIAAFLGREFDPAAIAAVGARSLATVEDALADTLAAGLILTAPRGRCLFRHALICETLCDELPPSERMARHHAIASALESMYALGLNEHAAEMAYHFARAGEGPARQKAIAYARRAGERALGLLAYEEAATQFGRAIENLARDGAGDAQRTELAELLLALGTAHGRAGATAAAQAAFSEAARLARGLGLPNLLAEAALGFSGFLWDEAGVRRDREIALLEEAAEALAGEESALLARVQSRLAVETYTSGSTERSRAFAENAARMARTAGDARALGAALDAQLVTLQGPHDLQRRMAIATELVELGRALRDVETELKGHHWRVVAALELGDVAQADIDIDSHERHAEYLRSPANRSWTTAFKAMRALLDGRISEAESLAIQAFSLGQPHEPNAAATLAAQMFFVAASTGVLAGLRTEIEEQARQRPRVLAVRAAIALIHAETGNARDAANELHRVAGGSFKDLRDDAHWFLCLSLCAQVVSLLGDTRTAAVIYDLLLPFGARNVVVGAGVACVGSVSHFLGSLAATLSRWDDGSRHFEDALAMHRRMGAPALVADTQSAYGAMLLRRGEPADDARATALLTPALETATRLGMKNVVARCTALLGERSPAVATVRAETIVASGSAPSPSQRYVCRREGDYWTFTYEGTAVRLRDSRGVAYLAHLLWHPGRELHVNELVDLVAGRSTAGARADGDLTVTTGTGDAGTMLDGAARSAYRRRVALLRDEIADAESTGDAARAARLQTELDAIALELRRSVRGRRAVAASERARIAVTKGIGSALARIRAGHPALGRHLEATVKRGYSCSYVPDPRHPIEWER